MGDIIGKIAHLCYSRAMLMMMMMGMPIIAIFSNSFFILLKIYVKFTGSGQRCYVLLPFFLSRLFNEYLMKIDGLYGIKYRVRNEFAVQIFSCPLIEVQLHFICIDFVVASN